MSASFVSTLPDATIAVGTSVSQTYDANGTYGGAALLGIAGKSAQQSLTFTLEVSRDGTNFFTLQAGATLANLPVPNATSAATYIEPLAFPYFRIKASGNATTNPVTFNMSVHWTGAGV